MVIKGLFVNFEGIDGSGTSTQVHRLEERLETLNKYQDILRTHEPWRSQAIKTKLEQDRDAYSDPHQMAELYIDDRAKHTRELILPNLKAGVVVLSSRYKPSTCAYQWVQGIPLQELLEMHENRGIINPDINFFLDVPEKIAFERIKKRKGKIEKFERNREFAEKLISAYNALLNMSQVDLRMFGKIVRIDGNRNVKEVADEIFSHFSEIYFP